MKTAKSIIVVLFVLLTAQIASAYYCPSTGRWLSRDPMGEPGFQTSQMTSVVRSMAGSPQLSPSRWINRDPLEEQGFNSLYGNLIHKKKSNSEIAFDYFSELFLKKPYLRQTIEPVVRTINWDAVNFPSNESRPIGEGNIYEFVNNNSVNAYDYLGLANSWPGLIDVQICFINVEPGSGLTFPPAIIFGFTPTSKHCSNYLAKKCCKMAQNTFNSVYNGVPGTSGTGYVVSLATAAAVFNSCVNLGH